MSVNCLPHIIIPAHASLSLPLSLFSPHRSPYCALASPHSPLPKVYVRGMECEDLSYFIRKVVFQLHPSFANPVRVVDRPPFEVTETGWGEFEVAIRIYFQDQSEVSVGKMRGEDERGRRERFHLTWFPPGVYRCVLCCVW